MTDLSKYPRIYCNLCEATNPMVAAEMPADKMNDHAAMDLLCSECRSIIATLHAPEAAA